MAAKSNLAVQDIAGLRGVLQHGEGYRAFILDLDVFYKFEIANVQADDGVGVIRPNNIIGPDAANAGRWVLILDASDVHAQMARITTQSITTGTATLIDHTTEEFDTDGMVDIATDGEIMTVQTTGTYQLSGACAWAGDATGKRELRISRVASGSPIVTFGLDIRPNAGAGVAMTNHVAAFLEALVAGQELGLVVLQDSGGNLNIDPGRGPVRLTARRVGP